MIFWYIFLFYRMVSAIKVYLGVNFYNWDINP